MVVYECLFLIARTPMTTHTIMMLKVRIIIPPPSITTTKKRMLPTLRSKELLLCVWNELEVLEIVLLKMVDAATVDNVAVTVVVMLQSSK